MGCPKNRAHPGSNRKCRHWHNSRISAVSRHARKDANPEQLRQIKQLSSLKLQPDERWYRYYCIFGGSSPQAEVDSRWTYMEEEEEITETRSATPSFENHISVGDSGDEPGEPPDCQFTDPPLGDLLWEGAAPLSDDFTASMSSYRGPDLDFYPNVDQESNTVEGALSPMSYDPTPSPNQRTMTAFQATPPRSIPYPQSFSPQAEAAEIQERSLFWCPQPGYNMHAVQRLGDLAWVNPTSRRQFSTGNQHSSHFQAYLPGYQTSEIPLNPGHSFSWSE